jgi:hypothetical protein
MASARFKIGMFNISVGTTGIRVGTKVGDALFSKQLLSFTKTKTKKEKGGN